MAHTTHAVHSSLVDGMGWDGMGRPESSSLPDDPPQGLIGFTAPASISIRPDQSRGGLTMQRGRQALQLPTTPLRLQGWLRYTHCDFGSTNVAR